MYLDEDTHKDLTYLARLEKKSMAEVTRDILKKSIKKIKKNKNIDTSGVKTLLAISKLGFKGGGDPYLSENIDHYLYGAPKRRK